MTSAGPDSGCVAARTLLSGPDVRNEKVLPQERSKSSPQTVAHPHVQPLANDMPPYKKRKIRGPSDRERSLSSLRSILLEGAPTTGSPAQGEIGFPRTRSMDHSMPSPIDHTCKRTSLMPDRPTVESGARNLESRKRRLRRRKTPTVELPPGFSRGQLSGAFSRSTRSPPLADSGTPSLFLWVGKHAEDDLDESITRNGFYDKFQSNVDESETARSRLWGASKNLPRAWRLSSSTASAFRQRTSWGKIREENNFKLPPRVTLTDSKREAWLKGLSNSMVSLRSLSRSIPHGIRGKTLLEQCLNKNVPISRAIWLVKCVGANEMRAFKRKGHGSVSVVGGESKWLKDWTTNVEQFMLLSMEDQGTRDWSQRYEYGLSLSNRLLRTKLIDTEQFLQWIIQSAANSSLDNLPTWLVLLNLHWRLITQQQKLGVYLVQTLMAHLETCIRLDHVPHVYQLLREVIIILRRTIAISPYCCVALDTSRLLEEYQNNFLFKNLPLLQISLLGMRDNLNEKQASLTRGLVPVPDLTSRRQLLNLFNGLSPCSNRLHVALACLRLTIDDATIIQSCLHWSIGLQRQSNFERSTAVAFMRWWARLGVDLQSLIHNALSTISAGHGHDLIGLGEILSELTSSGQFNLERYCHWAMARGLLGSAASAEPYKDLHVVLLRRLSALHRPLLDASHSVASLDTEIVQGNTNSVDRLKSWFLTRMRDPVSRDRPQDSATIISEVKLLDRATKFTISHWLRFVVHASDSHSVLKVISGTEDLESHAGAESLPPAPKLQAALDLIIHMGDFHVVAGFVRDIATLAQPQILLLLCDSINLHFEGFVGIGLAEALFGCLRDRWNQLAQLAINDTALLESFADLANRFAGYEELKESLRKQTADCTPEALHSGCTPVLGCPSQCCDTANSDTLDEFEQIVVGTMSLDSEQYHQVIRDVMVKVRRWQDDVAIWPQITRILSRLQVAQPDHFIALRSTFVMNTIAFRSAQNIIKILIPMICFGVLSLEAILTIALDILRDQEHESQHKEIALKILDLLATPKQKIARCPRVRHYRFYDQRSQLLRKTPSVVLDIFRSTPMAQYITQEPDLVSWNGLASERHTLILNELLCALVPGSQLSDLLTTDYGVKIGNYLINSAAHTSSQGIRSRIDDILTIASESTLVVSQVKFAALLHATDSVSEIMNAMFKHIFDSTFSTQGFQVSLWTYLFATLCHDHSDIACTVLLDLWVERLAFPVSTSSGERIKFGRKFSALSCSLFASRSNLDRSVLPGATSLVLTRVSQAWAEIQPFVPDSPSTSAVPKLLLQFLTSIQTDSLESPATSKALIFRVFGGLRVLYYKAESILSVTGLRTSFLALDGLTNLLGNGQMHPSSYNVQLDSKQSNSYANLLMRQTQQLYSDPFCRMLSRYNQAANPSEKAGPVQGGERQSGFGFRKWELISDAAPSPALNDTCLSLVLFGAQKSVLL